MIRLGRKTFSAHLSHPRDLLRQCGEATATGHRETEENTMTARMKNRCLVLPDAMKGIKKAGETDDRLHTGVIVESGSKPRRRVDLPRPGR